MDSAINASEHWSLINVLSGHLVLTAPFYCERKMPRAKKFGVKSKTHKKSMFERAFPWYNRKGKYDLEVAKEGQVTVNVTETYSSIMTFSVLLNFFTETNRVQVGHCCELCCFEPKIAH